MTDRRTGDAAASPVAVRLCRQPGGEGLPLWSPATSGSSGVDLRAAVSQDVIVQPGERVLVPTGFAMALPQGYEGQVRPRSGLALRHGITLPNAPGTIDADYRGEIKVILMNSGTEAFRISRGDRIAQLVIATVAHTAWHEVETLDETDRGDGGFGHTGR